jgi:hypothetical protein
VTRSWVKIVGGAKVFAHVSGPSRAS